tara:strand:+ start:1521 stop:2804 length:1284 start_codon:yes stop_codon:yes gene_type:complete
MAVPTLTPSSTTSAVRLPETGSITSAQTVANYPLGIYADTDSAVYDANFISGALDQVNYTFRKLGGDILDIELTEKNIFAAYEESVLEYSYILNIHQAKNSLGSALGGPTGSFDSDGQLSGSEVPPDLNLRYPRFDYGYSRAVGDRASTEVGIGGVQPIYSASIDTDIGKQDYDLDAIIRGDSDQYFASEIANHTDDRIIIRRVYYKTPHSMWRFYGYYGGLNSVGNLSTYGMYADDSTFEVVPAWQNKMQAMAYEDAIYTRNSHYSYEIKNNVLRIHPRPTTGSPSKIYVEFSVQVGAFDEVTGSLDNAARKGVNNMSTLPYTNLQFKKINSIGKQWIRRFALSLSKEMLGQVRGKFATVPIPGESVTLNASDLLTQAKEEQEKLREELKTVLDEMTYRKIAEQDAAMVKSVNETFQTIPYFVYTG